MEKTYSIDIWPLAQKYLKKLQKKEKNLYERYKSAIIDIAENPHIGEMKTGDLAGICSYDFKYKGTHYELAYRIFEDHNGNLIVIILCGTRENFYDHLKRYVKTTHILKSTPF
jgi:mRNA interferase RelE/StbE